jgi:hypothetical protein
VSPQLTEKGVDGNALTDRMPQPPSWPDRANWLPVLEKVWLSGFQYVFKCFGAQRDCLRKGRLACDLSFLP